MPETTDRPPRPGSRASDAALNAIRRDVGAQLRARRRALGRSVEHAADDAGYSSSAHVSKVERGDAGLSLRSLVHIAQAYGLTVRVELTPTETTDG